MISMKEWWRGALGAALVGALLVCMLALAGCTATPSSTTGPDPQPGSSTAATTVAPAPITPTYAATVADCRATILKTLEETGAASMSVALVDGETIVWNEAFGVAQTSTGAPPNTDTLYAIGSVSKLLATISVMKLVEQGKVKLDEPLVTYMPDFSMLSPGYQDITVRMLINHSSGFGGTDYRNGFMNEPFTGYAAQALEALKHERLKHDPGYLNVYCNDGFTMAENLVQAISGQSYPDFVRQEILAPLGMERSRYAQKPEDLLPGTYAESTMAGQLVTPEYVSIYGSGGLYSTPSDMARLAMMLMNGGSLGDTRILSPSSVEEMGTDQTAGTFNPVPCDLVRYGLGWDTVTQPGMKAVGVLGWSKNGGTLSYCSEFHVLPEERLAVVVLTDHSGGAKILAVAEEILLRALVERGSLEAMPQPLPETTLPEATPPESAQQALGGLYAGNLLLRRATVAPDGSLSVEAGTNDGWVAQHTNLRLRTDGWYTSDAEPMMSLRPVTGDGRSYLAVRSTSGYGHYLIEILTGEKLWAKPAVTEAWQARAGQTYLFANMSSADWSGMIDGFDPRFGLTALPDLPGYLFTRDMDVVDASVDDSLARMFLLIPGAKGRDLNDIAVVPQGGEEWLRQGSTLFRPLAGVSELTEGTSTVTIGSEGFNEWRTLPVTGTLSVSGGRAWRLFDAEFKLVASGRGSGGATLSGSGDAMYLVLFGAPGDTVTVNLT